MSSDFAVLMNGPIWRSHAGLSRLVRTVPGIHAQHGASPVRVIHSDGRAAS